MSRTLDLLRKSKPTLIAKAVAEMLGCMMFHFIGSLAPTPVANSVSLMTSVYYTAKVSGAHLNPAVSCSFCLLGFTHPVEVLIYVAAQIAGCTFGALLLALVVPGLEVGHTPPPGVLSGCFYPEPSLTPMQVFAWECIGTIMFIVLVQSVVWYSQNKAGYGQTGPIMVGLALYSSAMAVGPWTGAALNPARTLGSVIVYNCSLGGGMTASYIGGQFLATLLIPMFVIPWYGVASDAWYMAYVHPSCKSMLHPSETIILRTTVTDFV